MERRALFDGSPEWILTFVRTVAIGAGLVVTLDVFATAITQTSQPASCPNAGVPCRSSSPYPVLFWP